MKFVVVLCCAIIGCTVALKEEKNVAFFNKWKTTYNKIYETLAEEEKAFATWLGNWDKIVEHNLMYALKKVSYRLQMNHFGDLSHSEFRKTMGGCFNNELRLNRENKTGGNTYMRLLNYEAPKKVDWVEEGYVTPIKNQGQCGSCWSFSATGSLEGQHFKKTGKLVSLSEQNLVDCSTPEGNDGCEGGLMDQAFKYIKLNGGIDTEASYPYEAKDDTCRYKSSAVGADDVGHTDIPAGDEAALKEAVATVGPISVAIDASHESFQFYSSGVYSEPDCSSEQLDHGVLAVGYGTENGVDYWLVKNSWGTAWGESGYIKMSRNHDNQCGIASSASYPIV